MGKLAKKQTYPESGVASPGPMVIQDEETQFAEELRELNEAMPGWDRVSRVETARYMMTQQGMSEFDARAIYGDEIVDQALAGTETDKSAG